MGCGCAGVERAALTIAAAGAGAKILAPQGGTAVTCRGAALVLQGLAVECRSADSAVKCGSQGRAELSGCTLTSPYTGLWLEGGASATMDGGSASGCDYGVLCQGSGSTATVRPPLLRRLSAAGGGRGGVSWVVSRKPFFPAFFGPSQPPRRKDVACKRSRQKMMDEFN